MVTQNGIVTVGGDVTERAEQELSGVLAAFRAVGTGVSHV